MARRVYCGKTYFEPAFASAVFFAALAAGGAVALALTGNSPGEFILLPVAVLLAVYAIVRGGAIAKTHRTVIPLETGMVIEDANGAYEFRDEMITDLGTWTRYRYAGGERQAVVSECHIRVRVEDRVANLELVYEYGLRSDDPLAALLDRNLNRLTERAWLNRVNGEALTGVGWRLDPAGLTRLDGPKEQTLAVDAIAAAEMVDGTVSVWAVGQPLPFLKVRAGTSNALILNRVLARVLNDAGRSEEDVEEGLGRVIFERDDSTSFTTLALLAGLSFLFVLVGLVLFVRFVELFPEQHYVGAFLFGMPLLPLYMLFTRVEIFRCHTRGVSYVTSYRERQILYRDVRTFTYTSVRNYAEGVYTNTEITLKFEAAAETEGDTISYTAELNHDDAELDKLRDFVSQLLGRHMLQRLQQGRTVVWTEGVRFLPAGLEIPPAPTFGRDKKVVYPYANLEGTTLQEGTIFIHQFNRETPVYGIPSSAPNAFPGLILLSTILVALQEGHSVLGGADQPPAPRDGT